MVKPFHTSIKKQKCSEAEINKNKPRCVIKAMTDDHTNEGDMKIRLTAGGAVATHCLSLHEGTYCGGLDWNK